MTPERKKEIEKASDCFGLWGRGAEIFRLGAEWADEHPQKGLISLDRACGYIEAVFTSLMGYYSGSEYIDEFRKAMERVPES